MKFTESGISLSNIAMLLKFNKILPSLLCTLCIFLPCSLRLLQPHPVADLCPPEQLSPAPAVHTPRHEADAPLHRHVPETGGT